jgi:hypothetical protein
MALSAISPLPKRPSAVIKTHHSAISAPPRKFKRSINSFMVKVSPFGESVGRTSDFMLAGLTA